MLTNSIAYLDFEQRCPKARQKKCKNGLYRSAFKFDEAKSIDVKWFHKAVVYVRNYSQLGITMPSYIKQ